MSVEWVLLLVVIVVGFGAWMVSDYLKRQAQDKRRQAQSGEAKPALSTPRGSSPAPVNAAKSTGTVTPTASLSKKIRADNPITSDKVSLVATHSAARDEFLGTVEVLDGHHTGEAATRSYKREAKVLKSWQFLGFGDRYDSNQRTADFRDLADVFAAEVQTIIAQFRDQGWAVEPISTDREGEVYHLNR